MAHYFIGADGGSQSTKVSIFDEKGQVVCSASEPLKPMINRNLGWVEHPDDDLWTSLKIATQKAMAKFPYNPKDIKGLGLCTIRCCRCFMKADGSLAEPVMSWMDVRSYEAFEDREDIAYTSPTTGYMTWRLTGEKKDTIANTFQWQFPVDLDTWDWIQDKETFDSFKIPKEKLMDLVMPGEILGYVTPLAAAETGLPEGLPVVATGNDKAVEALGAGLIDETSALISLGTYIAAMVYGESHAKSPTNYWTNFSCIPHEFLYESNGIRGGMWHISWFKNLIGDDFAQKAAAKSLSAEQLLDEEAADTPPGADGLMIIPDWLAPASQLHRKGVMIGFDQRHTRGHIHRAIIEGIALTMKNNYEAMVEELGMKPEKLILSGGGSNSPLIMQTFADIFGIKTVRNEMNGAAGLGAAICAAVAVGEYGDFRQAVEGMVRERDSFTPQAQAVEIYKKHNDKAYKILPEMLEPTLIKMSEVSCEK